MIRSNLAVLLAERNLRISRVSADTGISRTTLTALSSNNFQGIQMDTLNQLCRYLNVRPESILHYIPYDVTVKEFVIEPDNYATIGFETNIDINPECFEITGIVHMKECYDEKENKWTMSSEFCADIWTTESDNLLARRILKQLPISFLKDIESKITRMIGERCENDIDEDDMFCTYRWDALM